MIATASRVQKKLIKNLIQTKNSRYIKELTQAIKQIWRVFKFVVTVKKHFPNDLTFPAHKAIQI